MVCEILLQGTQLSEQCKLHQLNFYVVPKVCPRWRDVGLALLFDGPELESIAQNNRTPCSPGEMCNKMWCWWTSKYPNASYDDIIKALCSLDKAGIANEVSEGSYKMFTCKILFY